MGSGDEKRQREAPMGSGDEKRQWEVVTRSGNEKQRPGATIAVIATGILFNDGKEIVLLKKTLPSKDLWKVAIKVIDLWTVVNKYKQSHFEMVFMDAK